MSLCGVCLAEIEDGKPKDKNNLGYDGCEDQENEENQDNYGDNHTW